MASLITLAQTHYENFPVGSRFIPKKYREVIHLIYAFARVADDIADEGNAAPAVKIEKLNQWERMLLLSVEGNASDEFFKKLSIVIKQFRLEVRHLQDLLVAFRKDAENLQYETFNDVLQYCKYSANPIGRLMLEIFQCSNETTIPLSDKICTALQLTNFWQDISVDTRRNRFYIPLGELQAYKLSLDNVKNRDTFPPFRLLMKHQVERTEKLFEEGKELFYHVPEDFRLELQLIWYGGMRVLDKIKKLDYDTRTERPMLTLLDKAVIFSNAIMAGKH